MTLSEQRRQREWFVLGTSSGTGFDLFTKDFIGTRPCEVSRHNRFAYALEGCTSMNVVSGLPGSVNHAGYFFSAAGFLSQFSRLMNITWIPADGALTSSAGRMPALNSLKSTLWPMDLSFSPS